MIQLLSRIFIKNHADTESPAVRQAYGMLCGALGVTLNLLLFLAKYIAGIISGSIAITADAFNNLSDAASSIITLLGFKLSSKKPDKDHPFGHGRFEAIAGLIVAFAILLMGFDLGKGSVEKILHPQAISFSWLSTGILLAAILVKLYMAVFNRRVGRLICSVSMKATSMDSFSDMCATAVVLISTLIFRFTGLSIDGWAGALVSLFILWAGFNAARDAISPLLGNAPDPALVERIRAIVGEYPAIVGMHDLLVHDYGAGRLIISFHAEVLASGDILELHEVIDDLERRLMQELNCSATIHMDPISTDDELVSETREMIRQRICTELGSEIGLHDFRMVERSSYTNVIFDVVVPYGYAMSDKQVAEAVTKLVLSTGKGYNAVVTVDHQ